MTVPERHQLKIARQTMQIVTVTDHDHEVFYCPDCQCAYTPSEVDLQIAGDGEVWAWCPGSDEPCRRVNEDLGRGAARLSSREHLEVCSDAVVGWYVMTYGGERYTSVAWYTDKAAAEAHVKRLLDCGYWSGMPPKIEAST